MLLQKMPVKFSFIAIASFFVYAMHVLNRLLSRKPAGLVGSFREESYHRYGKIYFITALISISDCPCFGVAKRGFAFHFFICYFFLPA